MTLPTPPPSAEEAAREYSKRIHISGYSVAFYAFLAGYERGHRDGLEEVLKLAGNNFDVNVDDIRALIDRKDTK